jgi:hypothetical protein
MMSKELAARASSSVQTVSKSENNSRETSKDLLRLNVAKMAVVMKRFDSIIKINFN